MPSRRNALVAHHEVPKKDDKRSDEGANGVQQRIPRRCRAAYDEGLVDFVEGGIACGDGEGGKGPSPTPAGAGATNATEQKQIENEVFCKMSGFADEKVDDGELVSGKRGKEPAKNGQDNRGSVIRRKGVSRKSEDATGPDQRRPPGMQPRRNERHAFAKFVEFRGGAGIAPGLFRQEMLQENLRVKRVRLRRRTLQELFHTVVGRLARDDDVVNV